MLTDLEALPILEVSEKVATYTCCVSITKTTYWLAAKHDSIFLKMPSNLGSLLRPLVPQHIEYAKLHSPQVMQIYNIKNCQNMNLNIVFVYIAIPYFFQQSVAVEKSTNSICIYQSIVRIVGI